MVATESVMTETSITEELIEHTCSLYGLKLNIENSQHNEFATRMAITRFAEGIGDINLLWLDGKYGEEHTIR
jgi:hypothetical protein